MAAKFTPWDPAWLQDPWPSYRQLREEDPVHWSEELGHWVLTRYNDIVAVARDPRFTATNRPPQRRWGRPTMMVTADPPEHSRLRRPVAHHFGSASVESLVPRMQEIVGTLLDAAAERGELDIAWDYARILPRRIISELMGLPYIAPERPRGPLNEFGMEEQRRPQPAMTTAAGMASRRRQAPAPGAEDIETAQDRWFKEAFAKHRDEVRDDVVQALLQAETNGAFTDEEVLDTATILYGAGQETTGSMVTNAVYQLLRHPEQLRVLCERPELLRTATDELLRFDAPVHAIRRKATADVEVGGKTVRAGQKVLLMLMAANHDPEVFERPDELDVTRQDVYHVAFGSGPHTCLGGILARAETQVAIGSLVGRFPAMSLARDDLRYQGSMVLRSVRELPVKLN